jgi:hypothetical protein
MSTMNRDEFHAALGRLESLAKGQLYHTPSDSNPGTWAGSSQEDQNEHEDGIDENGTDYAGVKKALAAKVAKSKALTPAEVAIVKGQDPRKLISDKISKGESLTAAEGWAVKGGVAKMGINIGPAVKKGNDGPEKAGVPGEDKDAGSVPDSNAGDDDEEIEPDAKKSLAGAIGSTQNLKKGIEMSPILAEFARAMGVALEGVEARTASRISKSFAGALAPVVARIEMVEKSVSGLVSDQSSFNKSFAEAMVGIGQQLAGGAEVASAAASAPAGAPKSHLRAISGGQGGGAPAGVQAVQKSFGPGGLDVSGDQFAKSQITDAMIDLVKGGKLNQLDVVKFETSGEMNPAVRNMVVGHLSAGAR